MTHSEKEGASRARAPPPLVLSRYALQGWGEGGRQGQGGAAETGPGRHHMPRGPQGQSAPADVCGTKGATRAGALPGRWRT